MTGTVGCVFMDDFRRHPSVSSDDPKHPKLPETTAKPYPPGVHVLCHQAGNNHHPAKVFFRDAHPHFDIDGCNGCERFSDCLQANGESYEEGGRHEER